MLYDAIYGFVLVAYDGNSTNRLTQMYACRKYICYMNINIIKHHINIIYTLYKHHIHTIIININPVVSATVGAPRLPRHIALSTALSCPTSSFPRSASGQSILRCCPPIFSCVFLSFYLLAQYPAGLFFASPCDLATCPNHFSLRLFT